jgi:hypothetical protein
MKRFIPAFAITLLLVVSFQTVSAQSFVYVFPTFANAVTNISGINDNIVIADTRTGGNTQAPEVGEPAHTCYNNDYSNSEADNSGTYTMWLGIPVPAGTLTVDTNGSNYDTVMSYYTGAGDFASMTSIGCIDDDIDSTATLSMAVPAGLVFVQISRFSMTTAVSVLELYVNVNFTPSGTIPVNDAFPTVTALGAPTFVKSTTLNVENAGVLTEDQFIPSCTTVHTNTVLYSVSTDGLEATVNYMFSVRAQQNFHLGQMNNTFIAVYDDTATEVACAANAPVPAAAAPIIPNVQINPNTTYTVQVGSTRFFQATGASNYTLVVQRVADASIFDYPLFQNPGAWKVSNGTDDYVGCPTTCYAVFTGSVGENSKMTRNAKLPVGLKIAKGDTLRALVSLSADSPGAVEFTAKIKIIYSDGKPATSSTLVVPYAFPGNLYTDFVVQATTTSKNIKKVQVQLSNASASGVINVRYVFVQWESARVATRGEALTLPLPGY